LIEDLTPFPVELSCPTPGAQITYTLDGSDPRTSQTALRKKKTRNRSRGLHNGWSKKKTRNRSRGLHNGWSNGPTGPAIQHTKWGRVPPPPPQFDLVFRISRGPEDARPSSTNTSRRRPKDHHPEQTSLNFRAPVRPELPRNGRPSNYQKGTRPLDHPRATSLEQTHRPLARLGPVVRPQCGPTCWSMRAWVFE